MQKMHKEIKALTPKCRLRFNILDERATIEEHNRCKLRTSMQKIKKQDVQNSSASPRICKGDYNLSNTTLKMYQQKHNGGNLEEAYSQTTRIISGHNTSMTKHKIQQVIQDQDDLLSKLKRKALNLELKSAKASRVFFSFTSNLETNDMPDQETYKKL